jgi:preprotein translocase subunit SecY
MCPYQLYTFVSCLSIRIPYVSVLITVHVVTVYVTQGKEQIPVTFEKHKSVPTESGFGCSFWFCGV